MSDQDFNFNPPPRRDAKKAFEPPPWEREQFEELARRKAAEKAAAEAEQAALAAAATAEKVETEQPRPVQTAAEQTPDAASAIESGAARAGTEAEVDARLDVMMLGLRNEEPPFGAGVWKVAIAAGAVLASVGVVLMVWGIFALSSARRIGTTGSLGGGILVAFGLGFIGVGGWMAFRTLRQQGVL